MAVTRWNPFSEFEDILNRYNRSLHQGQEPQSERDLVKRADWAPAVDIQETKEAFLIHAELPGVKKEDVQLSVHEGVLTLQGERHAQTESDDKKHHRIERFYGSFARTFRLPENVDEENIQAEYKDGVLSLTIAKMEKASPRAIEIKVQ